LGLDGVDKGPQMDWRAVLAPGGRWSPLVTAGSSAARVARTPAGLAYLAAPYATEVALRGDWRMERSVRMVTLASIEMARLLRAGIIAVCPTVQRAEMAQVARLAGIVLDPLTDPVWADLATALRNAARLVVVPAIQGWDRCPAVWADVIWALERNMPVHVYAERAG
jgi:hypothetical protein